MSIITQCCIAAVALSHVYIVYLEMFAWTTPLGRKTFSLIPRELFVPTKIFAANQGLYNGFLAAGLFWSLIIPDPQWSMNVAIFFLSCVAIAGIFGGITAMKKIFYIQALPAIVAIISLYVL